MKHIFAIGLIAGPVFLAGLDADAQTRGRRDVFCQPQPICAPGQIVTCRLYGDSNDACYCKSWSGCIGQPRLPSRAPSPLPQRRPVAPNIQIAPTR